MARSFELVVCVYLCWIVSFATAHGICDVRVKFGARGDNSSDDTEAFAKAVLAPDCGTIVVPAGAYLIKPLPAMRNNTELVIEPGAFIQGWRDVKTYPNASLAYYRRWNQEHSECFVITAGQPKVCRAAPLLRADGVENITIRGGGVIDGSGPQQWYNTTELCDPASAKYAFSYDFWHMCRPLLVSLNNIINLRVENITLLNGPYIHMGADAMNMKISHLTVNTAGWQCRGYDGAPNTDCVDISGQNIHVTHSSCHNGDDCFPLLPSWTNYSARGSAPPPPGDAVGLTANVLIENSICQCGNGVRVMPGIGAPRFGRIENVTYRNITSTNTSAAIRIAALAGQRGLAKNITFEDFKISGVRSNAIDITAYGQGVDAYGHLSASAVPCAAGTPPSPLPGSCMAMEDILIRNVQGDADKAGMILCGKDCVNFRMEHVHVRANASKCCAEVARGLLPPGTCYWDTCDGSSAVPNFSGYNCSGRLCSGCQNTARGTFWDCSPSPCLVSDDDLDGATLI